MKIVESKHSILYDQRCPMLTIFLAFVLNVVSSEAVHASVIDKCMFVSTSNKNLLKLFCSKIPVLKTLMYKKTDFTSNINYTFFCSSFSSLSLCSSLLLYLQTITVQSTPTMNLAGFGQNFEVTHRKSNLGLLPIMPLI